MIATNGVEYRNDDEHATRWGKYDSAFHAWLVETCDPDEYDGDKDYGGIALYGRRLDYWTSTGFHSLIEFDTVEEAVRDFEAWADEYYAPEVSIVEDALQIRSIRRGIHNADWMDGPDDTYRLIGSPGVAWRVYSVSISALYYRSEEVEYEPADDGRLWVYMVGDDSLSLVDASGLELLDEEDYCPSCGQIGCRWH